MRVPSQHRQADKKATGKKVDGGFTLVEMSIVLIIMSVVIGGGFAAATSYNERRKEEITSKRLDAIEAALLNFRKTYNRLPCPADGTLNPDNSNYGIEGANPGRCSGATPSANFTEATDFLQAKATRVTGGTAPVITLGLKAEDGIDGWGNKISYHVDARATETAAFSTYPVANGACFDIIIDDDKQFAPPWENDKNFIALHAVYALLSHGKDGHGAFSTGGARINAGITNKYQLENANADATGIDPTSNYDNIFTVLQETEDPDNAKNNFDDIVRFKTRGQLRTGQDGPGLAIPDLVVGSNGGFTEHMHFFTRCGDEFRRERDGLGATYAFGIFGLSISPDNAFILGSSAFSAFHLWIHDGIKGIEIPSSNITDYPSSSADVAHYVSWLDSNAFVLGSSTDFGGSDNNIAVYEKTGTNQFRMIDNPFPDGVVSDKVNTIVNASPDGKEVAMAIWFDTTGGGNPELHVRNPDNTFSIVSDAFQPALPNQSYEYTAWSPDMAYLAFVSGLSAPDNIFLLRNDGNHHYSQIPKPTPLPSEGLISVDFSPDSRFMVALAKNSAKWFIYENRNDVFTLISPLPDNLTGNGVQVKFSPDGNYLAITTEGDVVQIYKVNKSPVAGGTTFTLLTGAVGPDSLPTGVVGTAVRWKNPMPWAKGNP